MTAILAGYHDTPFVFISGDGAAVKESQELFPNIEADNLLKLPAF